MSYEECVLDSYIECNGYQYPCSSDGLNCYPRFACDYLKCSSSTKFTNVQVGSTTALLTSVVIPVLAVAFVIITVSSILICAIKKRQRARRNNLQNSQAGGFDSAFVIEPPPYDASANSYTNPTMEVSGIIPSAPPSYDEACIKYESDPAPPYQISGTSNNLPVQMSQTIS